MKYRPAVIVIMLIVVSANLFAQKYDEQITVVAPFEPSVSDANKISSEPQQFSVDIEKSNFDYIYTSFLGSTAMITPTGIAILDAGKYNGLSKKHIFYSKLGFGSNLEPFAHICVNSINNDKLSGGFSISHNSAWRQMDVLADNTYSNTNFDIYGNAKIKNTLLQLDAYYKHNMLHYFGLDTSYVATDILADTNLSQTYHRTGAKLTITNIKTANFAYDVSAKYDYLQDDFYYSQHEFSLPMNFTFFTKWFGKKVQNEKLNFNLNANFCSVQDANYSNLVYNLFLIDFEPSYSLTVGAFCFKLGVDVDFYNDKSQSTENYFKIHPAVEINTTVVPDAFSLRIGAKGDAHRNTISSLFDECKYIAPALVLRDNYNQRYNQFKDKDYNVFPTTVTNEAYNIYAFFDTRFGNFINFSTGVEFVKTENKAFFLSNAVEVNNVKVNQFDVVFDDINQTIISADLTISNNKNLIFSLNGKYFVNQLTDGEDLKYPYNLFDFEIYSLLKYTFGNDKISVGLQGFLLGPSVDVACFSPTADYFERPIMGDMGITGSYAIKKNIALWLNLNNLLHYNNKMMLYYAYPEYPANVMAGVTISL
jgi:hypothetical protein